MMMRLAALAAAEVTMSGLCQLGGVHPEPLRLAATAACQLHVFYVGRGPPGARIGVPPRVRKHCMAVMSASGHTPTHTAPSGRRDAVRWMWRTRPPLPSRGRTASRAATKASASCVESGGHWGGATGVLVPGAESAGTGTTRPCVACTGGCLLPCLFVRRAILAPRPSDVRSRWGGRLASCHRVMDLTGGDAAVPPPTTQGSGRGGNGQTGKSRSYHGRRESRGVQSGLEGGLTTAGTSWQPLLPPPPMMCSTSSAVYLWLFRCDTKIGTALPHAAGGWGRGRVVATAPSNERWDGGAIALPPTQTEEARAGGCARAEDSASTVMREPGLAFREGHRVHAGSGAARRAEGGGGVAGGGDLCVMSLYTCSWQGRGWYQAHRGPLLTRREPQPLTWKSQHKAPPADEPAAGHCARKIRRQPLVQARPH